MASETPQTPERSHEELQRLLQEALKKKRPRWSRWVITAMVTATVLLGLLGWYLYPRGEPPPLLVVAFDSLGVSGEAVALEGILEAPPDAKVALDGKEMLFVDGRMQLDPSQRPKEVAARTGPNGHVRCQWTFGPDTAQGDFILRLLGDKFRPGMEDRARAYLSSRTAPLCLVQVEETLTSAKEQAWQNENTLDITPMPGAGAALQQARRKGYQIVYLAVGADRATLYQKMRGWVRHRGAEGPTSLPPGPVLGRFTLPAAEQGGKLWQRSAAQLQTLFPQAKGAEPHLAIAGTVAAAQQFHTAGLRTFYLGTGEDLPQGVERFASWAEIEQRLE